MIMLYELIPKECYAFCFAESDQEALSIFHEKLREENIENKFLEIGANVLSISISKTVVEFIER